MDFFFDDLRLVVLIALWFLESTRTAGTHLRSGLAAENLRIQITAESRSLPDYIACLFLYTEGGTVRGKAGAEADRDLGA